jgi:hypothetical protein
MDGEPAGRAAWEHIEVFIAFEDDPHRASYLIHYGLDGRARSYRWVRDSARRGGRGRWGIAVQSSYETWLEGNDRQAVWQRMRDLLARLGADGWEAVGLTSEGEPDQPNLRYLFKRRASGPSPARGTDPGGAQAS